MKNFEKILLSVFTLIIVSIFTLQAQQVIEVDDNTNQVDILEVEYLVNNQTVTQTTPAAPSTERFISHYVDIQSIKLDNNGTETLEYFNNSAISTNIEYDDDVVGVSVYEANNNVHPNNNQAAFATALENMTKDSNLLHILRVDGASNLPTGYDYDLTLQTPMNDDDYMVVSERNGQSDIYFKALDANGDVMSDANTIHIGPAYGWNTGYSPANYPNQSMRLMVVRIPLFEAEEPIYGFKVDHAAGADLKLLLMSSNSFADNQLPVELTSFDANIQEKNILLEWSTYTEVNSARFEVQHSASGIQFSTIGKIAAAGDSKIMQQYNFLDQNPVAGDHYYRLKMVDKDGTTEYSDITHQYIDENTTKIALYPNPTSTGVFTVTLKNEAPNNIVQVINSAGQSIYQRQTDKDYLRVNLSNIEAGVYTLLVHNEETRTAKRVILR